MKRRIEFKEMENGWVAEEHGPGYSICRIGRLDDLVAHFFGIRNGPQLASLQQELRNLRARRKWTTYVTNLWKGRKSDE